MGSSGKFFVVSVFLFLLFCVSFPWVGAVDEDAAAMVLVDVEEVSVSAFNAALMAEDAGADISGLLERLNVGGDYLAEALNLYRLGAYDDASQYANLCREAVGDVASEAIVLREEAERVGEADFTFVLFRSVIGVVVVLILGFVIWRVVKRRYGNSVLRLRPEVVSGES
jgi:hypothetical protein